MQVGLLFAGLCAAAGGVALAISALRAPSVDAVAVLAGLDGEAPLLDEFSTQLRQPLLARLARPLGHGLATRIGCLLPHQRLDQLRHKILVAGLTATVGPEEFVVVQAVGAGAGLLGGLLLGGFAGWQGRGLFCLVVGQVAAGFFAPEAWLTRKRNERQSSIKRDLPDVLDLMAIAVEAGVGFEGAMEVVTLHFQSPLADELSRTLREMELGLPRREALQNLKRRTEVPELSNFVLILIQADALGMPIGRVLRSQAVEMRSKRRQWSREKAAKLPIKIMIPTTLFILPALFVVVLGPAAISIAQNL
jgi:tight adherence protein C